MYDRRNGPCCTPDRFRLDLSAGSGTPASPWNKSATHVFVESFVQSGDYTCKNRKEIFQCFATHIKHLKRVFEKQALAPDVLRRLQKQANRDERRRTLYQWRLNAAMTYAELRHHAEILIVLGPEAMSTDESDHENGLAQYRTRVKPWRAPAITVWLRVFDAFHRQARFRDVDRATEGSRPRLRVHGQTLSTRSAKSGLPLNFYNQTWLGRINPYDREILFPTDPYEFTHTDDVIL
ncbi:hypothetical protein BV25DRAFT_1815199 [Artomyces pyxidatus]|uniref:Uncharacterized protein n=3 Tax=Artomyces pyxidatus TaxID=48021 RepID=A0ACB8SI33_9AGAM|nr:hypothetical protein BV25DRAFT_1815976 [Artomyces pyxidatus]KAI0055720.1 hypothetical protein BV25DRAFT_1815194 [Artomyces pyxidatus]KAI0055741.1 hypothetical protein BV25DRAFT_1815199 [Artomyces pyxidatus]